jgi:hypothetical protein
MARTMARTKTSLCGTQALPCVFESLRRSIHGDLRQLSMPAFEKGTESDKEAAVSSAGIDLIQA